MFRGNLGNGHVFFYIMNLMHYYLNIVYLIVLDLNFLYQMLTFLLEFNIADLYASFLYAKTY